MAATTSTTAAAVKPQSGSTTCGAKLKNCVNSLAYRVTLLVVGLLCAGGAVAAHFYLGTGAMIAFAAVGGVSLIAFTALCIYNCKRSDRGDNQNVRSLVELWKTLNELDERDGIKDLDAHDKRYSEVEVEFGSAVNRASPADIRQFICQVPKDERGELAKGIILYQVPSEKLEDVRGWWETHFASEMKNPSDPLYGFLTRDLPKLNEEVFFMRITNKIPEEGFLEDEKVSAEICQDIRSYSKNKAALARDLTSSWLRDFGFSESKASQLQRWWEEHFAEEKTTPSDPLYNFLNVDLPKLCEEHTIIHRLWRKNPKEDALKICQEIRALKFCQPEIAYKFSNDWLRHGLLTADELKSWWEKHFTEEKHTQSDSLYNFLHVDLPKLCEKYATYTRLKQADPKADASEICEGIRKLEAADQHEIAHKLSSQWLMCKVITIDELKSWWQEHFAEEKSTQSDPLYDFLNTDLPNWQPFP